MSSFGTAARSVLRSGSACNAAARLLRGEAIEDTERLSTIKELLFNVMKGNNDFKTPRTCTSSSGQMLFADRDFERPKSESLIFESTKQPHVTLLDCSDRDYTVVTISNNKFKFYREILNGFHVLNAARYRIGNDELPEWRPSWGLTITSGWKSGYWGTDWKFEFWNFVV
ncbi:hypothetical protein CCACVL1_30737 [Corchorus capsularis]|uniref:Uncharacterized protein n=1 Tax=Corchorus capsularis TaxID=210143 RepID=A0A1R3FVZ4_COCAP|nr:hypothetical protein CCACVL1_30737 [Corchorus capsularis]